MFNTGGHDQAVFCGILCDKHFDSQLDINARDLLTEAALLYQDSTLKALSQGIFYEDNLWNFGLSGLETYKLIVSSIASPSRISP